MAALKEGSLSLDDSLTVFEEGIKISKILEDKLKEVEEKSFTNSQRRLKKKRGNI